MKRTHRRLAILVAATSLIAVACSSDDDSSDSDTTDAATEEAIPAAASLSADEQSSDGSTIVVASISLPAPGFIAVHADADGAPGAVIGNSDVLPAGESVDVTVTLDAPLTETAMVFPMAHIDIDDDGIYTFEPPDNAIDTPATTESGDVAVIGVLINVE